MRIPLRKATATALAVFALFSFQNCITLGRPKLTQDTQDIPVTSNPVGARIIVDSKETGQAPLVLSLKRNKNHRIRIEKEGFNPTELIITRKLAPVVPLALLAIPVGGAVGGGIGFLLWLAARHPDESLKNPPAELLAGMAIGAALGLAATVVTMTSAESYSLSPRSLEVTLTKVTGEGPPQVQVIYLDAEQLKDIQWLRIKLAGESHLDALAAANRR